MKLSLKNISSGTIVRGALTLFSLLQVALTTMGAMTPESTFGKIALCVLTAAVFLWSYWKNNSFTAAAQEADRLLTQLKEEENAQSI